MHGSLSVSAALTARSVGMCAVRAVLVFTPTRRLQHPHQDRLRSSRIRNMGLCSNHHAERACHGRVRLNAPLWYSASSRWCRDTTT